MALTVGTRLGPYEIVAAIGAGGMGEVFRARDTRLNRDVAIKVLPESFAADPGPSTDSAGSTDSPQAGSGSSRAKSRDERRARFEREAQAVAALSHPNILAIFDTGVNVGQLYVVTELLEGETLRDALQTGALPVRKAVDVAVQIAHGLAAAHDKHIVHRDLKPENVFLLADGQVKILDFGLARQVVTGTGATGTVAAMTDPAPSWAPSVTWRRNRCAARPSMGARTCLRWAPCCTRCSAASAHSGATRPPTRCSPS